MPIVRPSTIVLALLVALSGPTLAAEPKPTARDSGLALQPSQAEFTTRVVPAEAKPGEAVTLSVTAKMDPTWHVYAYSKAAVEEGPRPTQFDLFDPAGLRVEGDWSARPRPLKKKEPAFPEIPAVSYHEGEVTWSLRLVVPADARPGKKAIKVQASYQLCSDQTCSFPGRWTLPAAELTIVSGKAPARAGSRPGLGFVPTPFAAIASLLIAPDAPPTVDAPKPAIKDSSPRLKPKGVALTASVEPKEAKGGEMVNYKVTAKLNSNYHIYKFSKTKAESGPEYTTLDLFDSAGLTSKGDWIASREPTKKPEPVFKEIPFLEFYEDEVSWSLPLVVPAGAEPGKKELRSQAGYMICNDKSCSVFGRWTLPAVELTILPGGAVAATAPTSEGPATPKLTEEKPAATPAVEAGRSEIERRAASGLIPFLLTCAGGGLLALVMPCVWPMIPITVNFFVKQGQKKQGSTTGLAVAYCLAIIGVFTALGVIFSVFFGAASLSRLANNPWLNFGVAGLFLAFGLSLLGLFEIRLPNALLNASAQGEGRGGLVGVMFMAMTLTITSFTCTFPVVGGLLVMAAGGSYVYPIIGLATFATVLALPFFLLALSPGLMSKVPKSGDWMNTVKVIGGLVEIGAAFKFINTAECGFVVPSDAYFNAYAVLTAWVVLALVCGIYLLGLFRTDHDLEAAKVGPGRMILGCVFLFGALYLTPALFGRPPKGKLYEFVVGLLPADVGDLAAPIGGPAGGESTAASSTDPDKAEREQKTFHGVSWGMSYAAALEEAKAKKKPILIDFTGVNCANCRLMEQSVLPKPEVVAKLKDFVTIQLYCDYVPIQSLSAGTRKELAGANIERLLKYFGEVTNPLYVMIDPDEKVLAQQGGFIPPGEFVQLLDSALAKHRGETKVVAAGASR